MENIEIWVNTTYYHLHEFSKLYMTTDTKILKPSDTQDNDI